jgi:hypothetical protein
MDGGGVCSTLAVLSFRHFRERSGPRLGPYHAAMLDRERQEPIVQLTANDVDVPFEEGALVTGQVVLPSGIPGRTSWEVVLRNATVPLEGELVLVIDLGRRKFRGVGSVTSDDRQADGAFLLRTTVLAGSGDLTDD